ncbi:MAG: sporulation protein YqfD [Acutalibacteraceae bacterium]
MIIALFRLLKSYVIFEITGGFCGEFLTLCKNRGIQIFDIRQTDGGFICKTWAKSYPSLRYAARKTGTKLRIKKKKGIRFFIYNNRFRAGLLAGAVVFFIMLGCFSGRIWDIEIIGNSSIDSEQIYRLLDEFGIRIGCKKSSIDNVNIRQDFILQMPEIAWASFNINGSVLTLEIDERTFAPDVTNDLAPCSIYADCDAVIDQIEVYKGHGETVPGSAVKKGDLLVSGVEEYENGVTSLKHSRAKITGIVNEEYTEEIPLCETKLLRTGEAKTVRVLNIYGISIPLYLSLPSFSSYEKEITTRDLTVGNRTAPVYISEITFYETAESEVRLTMQEAADILRARFENSEKERFENAEILEKEESVIQTDDSVLMTVKYVIRKSIGETREITIEE